MASYSLITSEKPSAPEDSADKGAKANGRGRIPPFRLAGDILLLLGALFMILWPWGVLAAINSSGGIEVPDKIADSVANNRQLVSALVTFIGTLNRITATFLFGTAITRYGQELIATKAQEEALTVFDLKALTEKPQRSLIVFLLFVALASFASIPSGTASLIDPSPFNLTSSTELTGIELDFTSQDSECQSWLAETESPALTKVNVINMQAQDAATPASSISGGYTSWWSISANGQPSEQFTKDSPPIERRAPSIGLGVCLSENKMLDILNSGRDNMLMLPHDTYTALPRLLGTEAGVPFLGSSKGVLPIGPNGIPALRTQWNSSSLFVNSKPRKGILSYSYTTQQQGLLSNVACVYSDTSPIAFNESAPSDRLQYSGSCGDGQTSVSDAESTVEDSTQNGLAFMACKSTTPETPEAQLGPVYSIYLRGGRGPGYSTFVGNITCTVSPMHAGYFAVTYGTRDAYFTASPADKPTVPSNLSTHPALLQSSTHILGELVSWAQRWNSNMVAESVSTVGVKLFNISQAEQDEEYLKLYAATIQGVLDYTATSTIAGTAATCDMLSCAAGLG
ncbi:hypothetical protein MD484_g7636, partial [Candolleomyces efflorescens]